MAISYTHVYTDLLTLAGMYLEKSGYIPDNIFKGLVLVEYLLKKGNVKVVDGAGDRIQEPLMYAKNTTAKSYQGYDVLDTTPQDNFTMAEFQWKQISDSVTLSGKELRARRGPNEVKDLWKARVDNAILSLHDELQRQLWLDGTGNDGKDVDGLNIAIQEDPTGTTILSGLYGGINQNTNTWWRNYYKSAVGSAATYLLKEMRTAWRKISLNRRSGVPDVIFATSDAYGYYEAVLVANERFVMEGSGKTGDAGFGPLMFKGVPIEFDEGMPADSSSKARMFWLNTRYLQVKIHKDANFSPTPFVKPANQDAIVSQILAQLNLTCNNRRHQGIMFGLDA